jgi:hypothetical protein
VGKYPTGDTALPGAPLIRVPVGWLADLASSTREEGDKGGSGAVGYTSLFGTSPGSAKGAMRSSISGHSTFLENKSVKARNSQLLRSAVMPGDFTALLSAHGGMKLAESLLRSLEEAVCGGSPLTPKGRDRGRKRRSNERLSTKGSIKICFPREVNHALCD